MCLRATHRLREALADGVEGARVAGWMVAVGALCRPCRGAEPGGGGGAEMQLGVSWEFDARDSEATPDRPGRCRDADDVHEGPMPLLTETTAAE